MRYLKRTLLLSLLPLALFGVIWRVNWQREHPSATAADERARALLLSADSIQVRLEKAYYPGRIIEGSGWQITTITNLKPDALLPLSAYVNAGRSDSIIYSTVGAGSSLPSLDFNYLKRGQVQASLSICYGDSPTRPFFSAGTDPDTFACPLHPTSVRRLRQFIAQHPEIVRALLKAGVPPQKLKSD